MFNINSKNEVYRFDTVLITVSNDVNLYNRFFEENPFINLDNIKNVCFDNANNRNTIPQWYNKFLNEYKYTIESWFIFCHNDWELKEDIRPILAGLDKNCLYGPIGSKLDIYNNKVIPSLGHIGSITEQKRDGSNLREIGNAVDTQEMVDTFDCQAIIVHSSLVNKCHLRFDENLKWDLYVEDFCIMAGKKFDIKSYVIPIKCCHHSDASYKETPSSYYNALAYLNQKYPNDIYQGTVSLIGGKNFEQASAKEVMLYQLRKKVKRGN